MVPNNLVYFKQLLPRNFGNEIRFFETGFTDFEVLQWLITKKEKNTEKKGQSVGYCLTILQLQTVWIRGYS